jgi:CRP/FNR family cyclic AMP-dependent transcriptional regulator
MNSSTEVKSDGINVNFAPGEVIFNEGDEAKLLYIITKGEVELFVGDTVIGLERQGGIMGEMALINETVRSASARAVSECILDPIDREGFLSLIRRSPEFALHVMRVMADRTRHSTQMATGSGAE